MDRSLRMDEFGEMYAGGVCAKTAKRIVLREQIPHFILNGKVLVKESDAQAWRESKMVEPEKPTAEGEGGGDIEARAGRAAEGGFMNAAKPPVSVQPVTVDEIKHIDKGSLRAFATVTIAGKVTIHSVRIIQQKGKAAWVSMPANEVKSTDGGKSRWFPIVDVIDEKLKQQIQDDVLAEWRRRI